MQIGKAVGWTVRQEQKTRNCLVKMIWLGAGAEGQGDKGQV